jgi:formylglycine-generating enzyme required for sulfatase activity
MRSSFCPLVGSLFGILLASCAQTSHHPQTSPFERPGQEGSGLKPTISFDLGGGIALDLVLVEASSFIMGDQTGDAEEKPAHRVVITRPFYIGKFEVTQAQWQAVMNRNPSRFKAADGPVDSVSWEDCQAFIKQLNARFANSGVTFGLPTEAQWEYACRAASTGRCDGDGEEAGLADYGWFNANAEGHTHPVGQKKPNARGLYDTHGNVWEWCADWYEAGYYWESPTADPAGPSSGSSHVLRGGSWGDDAPYCRSTYRYCLPPWFRVYSYGLRVVCAVR